MTTNDLVSILTPDVRMAADHAKSDILSSLNPIQRVAVKALWPMALRLGVPAAIRIVIEFGIARYRRDLEPTIGEFVNGMADAIASENVPALAMVKNIMDVLRTPEGSFLPAVRLTMAGVLPSDGMKAGELEYMVKAAHHGLPRDQIRSDGGEIVDPTFNSF